MVSDEPSKEDWIFRISVYVTFYLLFRSIKLLLPRYISLKVITFPTESNKTKELAMQTAINIIPCSLCVYSHVYWLLWRVEVGRGRERRLRKCTHYIVEFGKVDRNKSEKTRGKFNLHKLKYSTWYSAKCTLCRKSWREDICSISRRNHHKGTNPPRRRRANNHSEMRKYFYYWISKKNFKFRLRGNSYFRVGRDTMVGVENKKEWRKDNIFIKY